MAVRKFADFTDDMHRPDSCAQWCKVHWYWDFHTESHQPYPREAYWRDVRNDRWVRMTVFVGPPAYYPKKPSREQMTNMAAHCPHTQGNLTCNHCLRHSFHPYTREELLRAL